MPIHRPLRVFLCHASQDKPAVRELYSRLKREEWIDPWLDEEKLLPGQDFDLEIYKAIRDADAIIICLSVESVAKEGYIQKEFKRALAFADEKPEGTIYIIPLRLNDCAPPSKFAQWQWVDYFAGSSPDKLLQSLRLRADSLDVQTEDDSAPVDRDLYKLVKIDLGSRAPVPYPFWISKYPVTNRQYERFLLADDFSNDEYWSEIPKFDGENRLVGVWGDEGLKWLQEKLKDYEYFPRDTWRIEPQLWDHPKFGIAQPHHPVVGVTWFEANAYCKWLSAHWQNLIEAEANPALSPKQIRLPLENEWALAAGGDRPSKRYPWDKPGKLTADIHEIVKRANIKESKIGHTLPVNQYPAGISFYGVMDMAGNVFEWQANCYSKDQNYMGLRGGSWFDVQDGARVAFSYGYPPFIRGDDIGFRVALFS
jgi:formylglycine-generating enzyme required for sulfatase activity